MSLLVEQETKNGPNLGGFTQ